MSLKFILVLVEVFCLGRINKVCCDDNSEYLSGSSVVFVNDDNESKHATSKSGKSATGALQELSIADGTNPFPNRSICGVDRGVDRIIGGETADIFDYPWLARIKSSNNGKDMYTCSGTLITKQHVLTAAHCVHYVNVLSVTLGDWNIDSEQDCFEEICNDGPVNIKVKKTISHFGYKRNKTFEHDIALLLLEHPVNFTDWIEPICLPTSDIALLENDRGATFITSGWGITTFGLKSSKKLKESLYTISFDECKIALADILNVTTNIICAGGNKAEASCKGDVGGPLFQTDGENNKINWYLYGIASIEFKKCGTAGVPGVYTRVTSYINWIREVIVELQ